MNSQPPLPPPDDREARLTALLLGELPDAEAAALRQELEHDADLRRLHDRLSRTIGLVRKAVAAPDQETVPGPDAPRLPAERRGQLLARFKVVPVRPSRWREWRRQHGREVAALAAMLVALLIVVGILTSESPYGRATEEGDGAVVLRGYSPVGAAKASLNPFNYLRRWTDAPEAHSERLTVIGGSAPSAAAPAAGEPPVVARRGFTAQLWGRSDASKSDTEKATLFAESLSDRPTSTPAPVDVARKYAEGEVAQSMRSGLAAGSGPSEGRARRLASIALPAADEAAPTSGAVTWEERSGAEAKAGDSFWFGNVPASGLVRTRVTEDAGVTDLALVPASPSIQPVPPPAPAPVETPAPTPTITVGDPVANLGFGEADKQSGLAANRPMPATRSISEITANRKALLDAAPAGVAQSDRFIPSGPAEPKAEDFVAGRFARVLSRPAPAPTTPPVAAPPPPMPATPVAGRPVESTEAKAMDALAASPPPIQPANPTADNLAYFAKGMKVQTGLDEKAASAKPAATPDPNAAVAVDAFITANQENQIAFSVSPSPVAMVTNSMAYSFQRNGAFGGGGFGGGGQNWAMQGVLTGKDAEQQSAQNQSFFASRLDSRLNARAKAPADDFSHAAFDTVQTKLWDTDSDGAATLGRRDEAAVEKVEKRFVATKEKGAPAGAQPQGRGRVEIALPAGERGEVRESLQLANGPVSAVVVNESMGRTPSDARTESEFANLGDQVMYGTVVAGVPVQAAGALGVAPAKPAPNRPPIQLGARADGEVEARKSGETGKSDAAKSRQELRQKLDSITIDQFASDGLQLNQVLEALSKEARKADPEGRGVNLVIAPNEPPGTAAAPVVDAATGLPIATPGGDHDVGTTTVTIHGPAPRGLTLRQALEVVAKTSDRPIEFSIEDYGIRVAAADTNKPAPNRPPVMLGARLAGRAGEGVEAKEHFELRESSLSNLLDDYGTLSGRKVVQGGSLADAKINVERPQLLKREEAAGVVEAILALNQVALVPQGDKFIRAVPQAQANTFGKKVEDLPADLYPDPATLVTHVISLTNAAPGELAQMLQPLSKLQNSIVTIPRSSTLVIRDYAENVKRMVELARRMDAPRPKPAPDAPVPQPELAAAENLFSTFSLNVSDVSFKLAAASLEQGRMPEAASVRTEEFINAFDYRDPEPGGSAPVAFAWERARYPFAQDRDLVRFSVKTAASGRQPGRPLNLVLAIDNSGSMERADRVRILRECLRVLGAQLQPPDRVSVVAFARTARLVVDGLPGSQAAELPERAGDLTPQGGTNLEDAMNVAWQAARRHYASNGVNRVVLLTDGAANLGDVDPQSLKRKVEAHRQEGFALDCFGIGWEGYNDELLEQLSRNGDGRYGFVNSPEAAATEFAGQLAGALKVAASDVKVQVEWNPRRVTAWRQLGYAKHQLKKEQFRDNTVDAAEIGAAEAGNALYTVQVNPAGEGPLGVVRVRFKVPGTSDYREHEWPLPYAGPARALEQSSPALRLAAGASAFSEWLVSSPYAAEVTPDKLLGYLRGVPEAWGADRRPARLEWMIRQARSLAGR